MPDVATPEAPPKAKFSTDADTPPRYNPDGAFGKAIKDGLAEMRGEKPPEAIAPPLPPKPEPKPAETPPAKPVIPTVEEDTAPDNLSEKAKSSWAKLREKATKHENESKTEKVAREAAEKKLTEMTAEIDKLKVIGSVEDVARLKTERDQFEQLVMQTNVELHPKFQAYFKGKVDAVISDVTAAAGEQANAIMEIIQRPDSQAKREALTEAMAGLDPIAQQEVVVANREYRKIQSERMAEVTKSKENFTKVAEERKAAGEKAQAEAKGRVEALFTAKMAEFSDPEKGLPIFRKVEGDEAWNKGVDENIALVKRFSMGQNTPEQLAEVSFFAVQGLRAQQLLTAANTEITNLKKQVADLSASAPLAPGGGGAPADKAAIPAIHDPAHGTWAQRMSKAIRGEIPVEQVNNRD